MSRREKLIKINESIKKTWGDPNWRKAKTIYDHHMKRLSQDHWGQEPGIVANGRGIRGKIARAAITATAPLGRKLQLAHKRTERGGKEEKKIGRLGHYLTHGGPDTVWKLKFHYDNIHNIAQRLNRNKLPKINEAVVRDHARVKKLVNYLGKRAKRANPDGYMKVKRQAPNDETLKPWGFHRVAKNQTVPAHEIEGRQTWLKADSLKDSLKNRMRKGGRDKPIMVYRKPNPKPGGPKYRILDGHHRDKIAQAYGDKTRNVDVYDPGDPISHGIKKAFNRIRGK